MSSGNGGRRAALALAIAALPIGSLSADPVTTFEAQLSAPEATRRVRAVRELVGLEPARARPFVRRALDDSDLEVRIAATSAAAQLGLVEFTGTILGRATSSETRMREAVVTALGVLRPTNDDVRALEAVLVRAVSDAEPTVRAAALRSLAERPVRPSARTAQLDAIAVALGDERPELRRAAAEMLEHLADPASLHALAAHVDDASPEVRLAVAHALGALGDPRAAPSVLRLADDASEEVKAAAIATLGALAASIAVPRLTPIIERPRDPLAGVAAVALGRIAGGGVSSDDSTTTALRARAGDAIVAACRRGENRAAALEGLRATGAKSAALLQALLPALGPRPGDELVLLAAERAAAGDEATIELLLDDARLATDGRFDAALTGARPRAGATRDRLVVWLAARLGDPGAASRRAAADALGALGDPRAARALAALDHDPDAATRRAGLAALARTAGAPEPALVAAARGTDGDLARTAIAALARRKDNVARQTLVAALSSPDPSTQHAAAFALADDAGAANTIAPLLAILRAGPRSAREAAALALHGPLRGHVDATAREVCLGIAATDDPGASGALELLGAMRDRASLDRLIALVPKLGKRPLRRARLYAVLGDLLLGGSIASLERALLTALSDPDPAARAAAAWALGKGTPRASGPVVDALSMRLSDPSAAMRTNALGALARLGAKLAPEVLARAAQDREAGVRANAVRAGGLVAPRENGTPLLTRAQAVHEAPRIGSDYLLLRIVDDAPIAARPTAARIGLPDGLVEVVVIDERGIARDEGVTSGSLLVEVDASLLR